MTDDQVEDGGTSLDDLRKRVRAAEERFEKLGRENRASRARMVELVTALDNEREDRLDQIAGLEEQVTTLKGENSQLRDLLTELLAVVEDVGSDDGLAGLEAELKREAAEAAESEEDEEDLSEDEEAEVEDAAALLATAGVTVAAEVVSEPAEEEAEEEVSEAAAEEVAEVEAEETAEVEAEETAEADEAEDVAEAEEEDTLELGEPEAEPEPEQQPEAEEAAPEKSDSDTDQLDRILRSIRRITS